MKRNNRCLFTFFSLLIPLSFLFFIEGRALLNTITKSFTNWNGSDNWQFIGLQNYIHILKSEEFFIMLINSLIILLYIPVSVLIGLVLSVYIYETKLHTFVVYLVYLPQILSAVVSGKIFQFLFSLTGPVNQLLKIIGLHEVYFFGNRWMSFGVIILSLVWMDYGWHTIYLSGFLSTKNSYIQDLILLDGVKIFCKIVKIYIPILWPALKSSLLITMLFSFSNMFPLIFLMTKGGPGYGTTTIDYLIYDKSFSLGGNLGEASALSVILLLILLIVLFGSINLSYYKRKKEDKL